MREKYKKPQMKAPRVTPLEGVSRSTVTPVDCVHTYASARAYVDERPQGAQPLTYALRGIRVRRENPQGFGIDERRFVNLNIQHFSEFYQRNSLIISPQSAQRSQSFAIPATAYEPAPPSRRRTRMTQIARIFTDQRASASSAVSVFYRIPSAFICVHLRLLFVSLSDRIREIQFDLFPIINENGFVPVPSGV
jgi:hypothetical protein